MSFLQPSFKMELDRGVRHSTSHPRVNPKKKCWSELWKLQELSGIKHLGMSPLRLGAKTVLAMTSSNLPVIRVQQT
jgi:hypothetical protein